jgi:hypothetical protein
MMASNQLDKDHLYAFSCALNLLLYVADPGPESAAVGGPGERRMISRRESLVDIYARMLLLELEGDTSRLSAVAVEARRRRQDKEMRDFPADHLQAEEAAAELAESAARIVHDAGADTDPRARERLLTATDYQTSHDVFGAFLGDPTLAGPPDAMLAELDRIDEDGQDQ